MNDEKKAMLAPRRRHRAYSRLNAVLLYATVFLALPSCNSGPSIEERLVGKWETFEHQPDGSQTAIVIMFAEDGRYLWSFRGKPPVVTGRWRFEGKELLTIIETQAKDSGLPLLPPQLRYQIVRVTKRELVISDGTAERRWARVQ